MTRRRGPFHAIRQQLRWWRLMFTPRPRIER